MCETDREGQGDITPMMTINLEGRVQNTRLRADRGLLALYEAVVNSMDSVEETGDDADAHRIEIHIRRERRLVDGDGPSSPDARIVGFEVVDDGVGFTQANFQSFLTADSRRKAGSGGKGNGRFLWLKVFETASVESVFREGDACYRRRFQFTRQGISDHTCDDIASTSPRTRVVLESVRRDYQRCIPPSAHDVAKGILEHCLEWFILGRAPEVIVRDEATDDVTDLHALYGQVVHEAEPDTIEVGSHPLCIRHLHLPGAAGGRHRIAYCAHRRLVREEEAAKRGRVPHLATSGPLRAGDDEFIYAAYVTSELLDASVNQERTDFVLATDEDGLLDDDPTWDQVEAAVLEPIRRHLEPYTRETKADTLERVRRYVSSRAPEYGHILTHHEDRLDAIAPGISERDLDAKLHRLGRAIEDDLRAQYPQICERIAPSPGSPLSKDDLEQFSQFWEDYNAAGRSALAKYVVGRRYALTLLERAIRLGRDGRHSAEGLVHGIVFPRGARSDDVPLDAHNLWLIDERLAFHTYLGSDVPISQMPHLDSVSRHRPDLQVFFDNPLAVAEEGSMPYSSVVLVEFKKPGRGEYAESENPITQVYGYLDKIRAGGLKTAAGRTLEATEHVPFYCYVIADLVPSLKTMAINASLRRTLDGLGYFGWNLERGAYIEVMGFDKLVGDAHKRNRALFERLGLPPDLGRDDTDSVAAPAGE